MKEFAFLATWSDEKSDSSVSAKGIADADVTIDLMNKSRGRFFRLLGRKNFVMKPIEITEEGMIQTIKNIILAAGVDVTDLQIYRGDKVR